jgi:hypothetical protein
MVELVLAEQARVILTQLVVEVELDKLVPMEPLLALVRVEMV